MVIFVDDYDIDYPNIKLADNKNYKQMVSRHLECSHTATNPAERL